MPLPLTLASLDLSPRAGRGLHVRHFPAASRLANCRTRASRCAPPHFASACAHATRGSLLVDPGGHDLGGNVMTIIAANRRGFLCAMLGAGALVIGRRAYGAETTPDVSRLKPGEFTWRPELAARDRWPSWCRSPSSACMSIATACASPSRPARPASPDTRRRPASSSSCRRTGTTTRRPTTTRRCRT